VSGAVLTVDDRRVDANVSEVPLVVRATHGYVGILIATVFPDDDSLESRFAVIAALPVRPIATGNGDPRGEINILLIDSSTDQNPAAIVLTGCLDRLLDRAASIVGCQTVAGAIFTNERRVGQLPVDAITVEIHVAIGSVDIRLIVARWQALASILELQVRVDESVSAASEATACRIHSRSIALTTGTCAVGIPSRAIVEA
jgi:hypothetical protein